MSIERYSSLDQTPAVEQIDTNEGVKTAFATRMRLRKLGHAGALALGIATVFKGPDTLNHEIRESFASAPADTSEAQAQVALDQAPNMDLVLDKVLEGQALTSAENTIFKTTLNNQARLEHAGETYYVRAMKTPEGLVNVKLTNVKDVPKTKPVEDEKILASGM